MKPQEAINLINKIAFAVNNEIEEIKASKFITALKKAISALEKQIPKKPLPVREVRSGRIVSFTCPNCSHEDLGENQYRFKCCEDCGQALDWSDIE